MRKNKSLKIDDKEISVKELTVKELLFLAEHAGWVKGFPGIDFSANKDGRPLYDVMLSFVVDLTVKELVTLAPSEIEVLYKSFMEVNKTAFELIKYLGMDTVFDDLKKNLVSSFVSDCAAIFSIGGKNKNERATKK